MLDLPPPPVAPAPEPALLNLKSPAPKPEPDLESPAPEPPAPEGPAPGPPLQRRLKVESKPELSSPLGKKKLQVGSLEELSSLPAPEDIIDAVEEAVDEAMDGFLHEGMEEPGPEPPPLKGPETAQQEQEESVIAKEVLGRMALANGNGEEKEEDAEPPPKLHRVARGRVISIPDPVPRQPTPPAPLNPELEALLQQAQEMFNSLPDMLQMPSLAQEHLASPESPFARFFKQLSAILQDIGELAIEVTPYELLLHGHPVYRASAPLMDLCCTIYYQGLKQLTFSPGLTAQELVKLLRILRRRALDDEQDTITRLWMEDLPHVGHQTADIFHLGLFHRWDVDLQADQDELFHRVRQPLHNTDEAMDTTALPGTPEFSLWQRLHKLVVSLQAAPGDISAEDALTKLNKNGAGSISDLWERGFYLMIRMAGAQQEGPASPAGLCRRIISAVQGEQWDQVAAFGKALINTLSPLGPEALREPALLVRGELQATLLADGLKMLRDILVQANSEVMDKITDLLMVLPTQADKQLVALLDDITDHGAQAQFLDVLRRRDVDLMKIYLKRLESPRLQDLLVAIEVLGGLDTGEAHDAIAPLLEHPNPKVRLAAVQAFDGHLEASAIPILVDSLSISHMDLRQKCIEVLETLPLGPAAALLLPLFQQGLVAEMHMAHRRRLVQILINGGGAEAADYLIKQICVKNLLHVSDVEKTRQDLIKAVAATGGPRGRKILEDSLKRWTLPKTRAAIREALQAREGGK